MIPKMIILTIIMMMTILLRWTNGQGLITRGVEQYLHSHSYSWSTIMPKMIIIIWAWTNGQGLITRGVEQWRISNWTSFKTFGTARRNLKVNEIHDDQFCGVCKNTNTNINKNTDDRIKKQMKQMYRVIYVRPKITNIELKYPIIAGYKIETLFLSKVYNIAQRGWNKSITQSDLLSCEDWWSDCTSHKSASAINPYFQRLTC